MWRNKPTKHLNRFSGLAIALILTVLLTAACGSGNKSLAVYKNSKDGEEQKIVKKELDAFIGVNKLLYPELVLYEQDPSFEDNMLRQLISFKILSSRLREDLKDEAEEKAKEDYELFIEMYEGSLGKEEVDKHFKTLGITRDDLKNFIYQYTYTMDYLSQDITDEDIKAEYDAALEENEHSFTIATVRHVLISVKDSQSGEEVRTFDEALERANEVRQKLLDGGDFEEIAEEYSDDPGSKNNGGLYEDANVNYWVEPFRDAVLTLDINEISEPVKTEYGYHIIKVEERTQQSMDDMKEELRGQLVQKQYNDFIENEFEDLIVSINLPRKS